MKKRLLIRKKQALLFYSLCFMLLCANGIQAQDTYTWVPGTAGNWSTAASWTKVGTATTNTTPGGTGGGGDIVVINNGTCTLDVDAAIARLTVGSLATPAQGILNISATKTLAITNIASNSPTTSAIILAGGKINNNGTLTVTASATTGTTTPITVNSPPNLTPGLDWGYGGSGVLSVASTSTTAPTPAATIINVNNTALTAEVPVFTFNNPTFTLANNFYVFTAAGLSRVKIGGNLTINPSSINNGFLNNNNGTVEVLAGATITVASNNISNAGSHTMQFNGGILNNYGTISCTGNTVSTVRLQGNSPVTCAFNNYGTYTSDTKGFGFYSNSGSAVSATIDNKSTGLIVIKNSSAQSLKLQMAATKYIMINSGTMNLTGGGSSPAAANNEIFSKLSPDQSSLTNSGTITSNNVFAQYYPPVSFQDAANTVTLNGHSLVNGNIISFSTVATTTGIVINTPYYVVSATTNTFQVATTLSGSPIDLVTDGTGALNVAPLLINNTGTINYLPNITITQTALTGFAATNTNASASKSFVAAGTNLTGNLAVGFNPASTDYEFSTDDFVTAGVSSLSLTPSSGTVANTTVYVRLKSAPSAAAPTATVALTSASATTRTVALSGDVTLKNIDRAVSSFALYPNPSKSNSFNVVVPHGMSKTSLTVSNLLGQKLYSQDDLQSGATERVTVDNVNTSGVYLVRLTSEGKTATTKWIVE